MISIVALLALAQVDPVIAQPERALAGAKCFEQTVPGALAEGLVKTRLLETLNRLDLAPRDATKALDPSAFTAICVLEREGRKYAAAFNAAKKARYLLVRIPVPIDRTDPSPKRLRALREAREHLERAGFKLEPKETDRYGNTFVWQGRGIRAVYVPEEDELRAVIHQDN